jgi:hypothetical protein
MAKIFIDSTDGRDYNDRNSKKYKNDNEGSTSKGSIIESRWQVEMRYGFSGEKHLGVADRKRCK